MTRIFYTTDIHGSDKCFRKFINAGKFYKADVIICGGDITGKLIVPIVRKSECYEAQFMGRREIATSEKGLQELQGRIRMQGFYAYVATEENFKELSEDRDKLDELFAALMTQTLETWISFAEERLKGSTIKCFVTPGNDDRFEMDAILEKCSVLTNPEGKVVYIDEYHEMASTGFSNMTPWKCPRDITEEELQKKIDDMCSQVREMDTCIFNFHVPPINTKLDDAPKLDENLKVVAIMGNPIMAPAGSSAVRNAIQRYQPLLGLHGHIHESKNVDTIGKTFIINPGSEYSEGILHGAVVDLDRRSIKNYVLVEG